MTEEIDLRKVARTPGLAIFPDPATPLRLCTQTR